MQFGMRSMGYRRRIAEIKSLIDSMLSSKRQLGSIPLALSVSDIAGIIGYSSMLAAMSASISVFVMCWNPYLTLFLAKSSSR